MKKKNGFSLISISVVICIISIFAVLFFPAMKKAIEREQNQTNEKTIPGSEKIGTLYHYPIHRFYDRENGKILYSLDSRTLVVTDMPQNK